MSVSRAVLATRHRLVAEIGEPGVAALAATSVHLRDLSPGASEVARRFLERADVSVEERGQAPDEPFGEAYLRGAWIALEHVARTVGVRNDAPAVPFAPLLGVVRAGSGVVRAGSGVVRAGSAGTEG